MSILTLGAALFAAIYGVSTAHRRKTPLFYKIVVYGFCCYLLSALHCTLLGELFGEFPSVHIGYLGYIGAFLFLFSSYFGALDRLADGYAPAHRIYRIAALLPSLLILALGIFLAETLPLLLTLLPAAAVAYFACKHLILPDVDMGIIRAMRPYNAVVLALCLLQPFAIEGLLLNRPIAGIAIANSLLLLSAVPICRKVVSKWFM